MARQPLEILLSVTRLLSEERSLEESLQATTDAALELVPCDHASLRLFDDDRESLMSHARSGEGSLRPPASFRAREGVLGLVAETGRAALVLDSDTDPRFDGRPVGFAVRSLVAVPMMSGGKCIGVLSASSKEPNAFTERDRDLTQLLANCTVPAIESARLMQLAETDDLTRAYNHRVLAPRLTEEVSRAERHGTPLSLLMLDLDHFKKVNDRYGHAVGDEVLRGFADRVRAEVRHHDILIRRGGEEFLLVMPQTGAEEAATVAERIRARVASAPIETQRRGPVDLTVSIGVATWSEGEDARALEAHADAALYRAKDEGRNRIATSRLSIPPPPPPR